MKILLICVGGMSSSVLMERMRQYAAEHDEPLTIEAVGEMGHAYEKVAGEYDVILMAPQAGYRKKDVMKRVSIPVDVIDMAAYGRADCAKLFEQARRLLDK